MMSAELSMATIDFSKLEFCKNSDGSLQRLGEGAFGSVYKVLLDGVQLLAAKSIDLGHDPADQSAFLQVRLCVHLAGLFRLELGFSEVR